jgi:hypothetical protein
MAILHPFPPPMVNRLLALLACSGAVLAGLGSAPAPVWAQSQLLESVKQNPARAQALCRQLRSFNAEGLSATSPQAVAQIARQENLSPMDAEVLTTYVVGLHCPDVR